MTIDRDWDETERLHDIIDEQQADTRRFADELFIALDERNAALQRIEAMMVQIEAERTKWVHTGFYGAYGVNIANMLDAIRDTGKQVKT